MRICAVLALVALTPFVGRALCLPVVKTGEMAETFVRKCPGTVVAISRVDVVPQVSGEILEVGFRNGQAVKKGDVLFRLDPVKYNAAVKNAEAKVAEAKAVREYSEITMARYEELVKTRAVSQDEYDKARSARETSIATLAAAEADLLAAKDDLAHCTIVAPIAGRLGTTSKTKGNYVNKGSETLVTLVQQDPVRVRFSIANRDLLENFRGTGISREDATVDLTLADGVTMVRDGVPEYMENAADEQTDTVQVYVRFGNADKLLTVGGTVGVTLTARKGAVRPAIPPTAILQDTQGPYVWALGPDGRAERRTVARGDLGGDWLFIEKGLKIGERVVADGAHKVRKGDVIRPAPTSR